MVSNTVIVNMFLKTAELPPITKIHTGNKDGGHEPEVHIYIYMALSYPYLYPIILPIPYHNPQIRSFSPYIVGIAGVGIVGFGIPVCTPSTL